MKVVGITACPTGIAHTYMAQESLELALKNLGYDYKIETQGGMGIENELSPEDIADADVAILAVSVVIDGEERFDDIPTLRVDVGRAIKDTDNVIQEAIALVNK